MRIGLFGGSFNPIHNGHVTLGKTMLGVMRLDEVWYMISPQNPLKKTADLLDEEERRKMVVAALEGEKGLKASDFEFHLPRPSYTWNTLQKLHRQFPEDEFVLIIGGDNWQKFHKWAHNEDILASHEIAIFPREGAEIDAKALPANVTLVEVPLVNVTSTMLREMTRRGESIEDFVPKSVADMVKNRSFYV